MKKIIILLISLLLFGCIYNVKKTQYSDIDTKQQSFKDKLRQFLLAGKYTILHLNILDGTNVQIKFGGEYGLVFYQNFDSDLAEKKSGDQEQGYQVFDSDNYFPFAAKFSPVGEQIRGENVIPFNALLGDDLRISYDLKTQTLDNTDWNRLAWLEDEHWLYVDKKNWDGSNYSTYASNQMGLNIYHLAQVFDHITPSSSN